MYTLMRSTFQDCKLNHLTAFSQDAVERVQEAQAIKDSHERRRESQQSLVGVSGRLWVVRLKNYAILKYKATMDIKV